MCTSVQPYVTNAERLDGNVVISFGDGKTALYSAVLLYAMMNEAEELREAGEEE